MIPKQPHKAPEAGITDGERLLFLWLLLAAVVFSPDPGYTAQQQTWSWRLSLMAPMDMETMQLPTAVYADPTKERYYVVDFGNNRLLSFSRDGSFVNQFSADDKLQRPFDFSRRDQLWVTEKYGPRLTRIDLKTRTVRQQPLLFNGRPIAADRLILHQDFAYILNRQDGAIIRYDKNLQAQGHFSDPRQEQGFIDFQIIDDDLYALANGKPAISHFSHRTGAVKKTIVLTGGPKRFYHSLAIEPHSGQLFLLDRQQARIDVFSKSGTLLYAFGSRGNNQGEFYFPTQIRFDPWGGLCIVDQGNGRVEIYRR